MAAEMMMVSPLPRKALEISHTLPTSPYPASDIDVEELRAGRSLGYDANDQATKDLRDVLGYEGCATPTKVPPNWQPSLISRCLSSASTCATSPPPPSSISPPLSPDLAFAAARSDCSDGIESPTYSQQPQCPHGAPDKSSWLQVRKVFVGGISQSIDQNGLHHMFSKFGKIKKAWLQLFHGDHDAGQVHKEKKHRGFGFVIFYEKQAIDQLLGDAFSKFVSFPEDVKLEVKRAVGKTSSLMFDEQHRPGNGSKLANAACKAGQSASSAVPLTQSQLNAAANHHTLRCSPVVSQPCQHVPSQALPIGFQVYANLPWVPPFPLATPSQVKWPLGSSLPSTASASLPSCPSADLKAELHKLHNILLGGFVGHKPRNSQELERVLLEALPDHYDD